MKHPPRTNPLPPHSDVRQRPRRPVPQPPRRHLARNLPWVGLIVWGTIFGALGAVSWQVWRWTAPMFDAPPLPPFAEGNPPRLSAPAPTEPPAEEAETPAIAEATPQRPDSVPGSLEEGSRGRVVEPIGLALRAEPNVEGAYLGGIAFDETVTILELSGDGRWQRVRRNLNGQEGWVKAGNITAVQ
ncbi:SH3 domain-containing protein [Synechococcus sp. PCC 7336]|uniref:SH3 domain-containing protein n=1 Tax=Synechococcus sp. PCC 7336 TaxID=195250 RepID=UPI000349ABEC|nr:SH3 domain-containing protein [Synechococcus sp. PCC 7336]